LTCWRAFSFGATAYFNVILYFNANLLGLLVQNDDMLML